MNEKGFTMLEIMVALTIFGIVAAGMAQAYVLQLHTNNASEVRSQAIQAAQRVLDDIRTKDITQLPSSGNAAPQTILVNNRSFIVKIQYCPPTTAYCSTAQRFLRSKVFYKNKQVYAIDTVFAQLR